ncbi:hypothetical protein MUG91_G219n4, partial [Manis pentadactyla]
EFIQETIKTALGFLRARKEEAFVSFHDVAVDFTQKEWQLLSYAQRTLHKNVMLENFSNLFFGGIPFSKPALIILLEQGEEPWTMQRECLPSPHSAEPKPETQPYSSCALDVHRQQLGQQVLHPHRLPLCPDLCEGTLQFAGVCPAHQKHRWQALPYESFGVMEWK